VRVVHNCRTGATSKRVVSLRQKGYLRAPTGSKALERELGGCPISLPSQMGIQEQATPSGPGLQRAEATKEKSAQLANEPRAPFSRRDIIQRQYNRKMRFCHRTKVGFAVRTKDDPGDRVLLPQCYDVHNKPRICPTTIVVVSDSQDREHLRPSRQHRRPEGRPAPREGHRGQPECDCTG
jgi:hypothetical protein